MNVSYILDREDGVDPTDPLGDLEFVDQAGKKLVLKDTFVDTWLVALLKGLISSESLKIGSIEVLEEPYKIELYLQGENVTLALEDQLVESSVEGVVSAVRLASRKLVDELSEFEGFDKNMALKELQLLLRTR